MTLGSLTPACMWQEYKPGYVIRQTIMSESTWYPQHQMSELHQVRGHDESRLMVQ